MESGIYIIKNIIDNRVYIGSAINIFMRKATHLYNLRHNKHQNQHLQNFYNKYGEKSLFFEILEKCEKPFLIEREQFYINYYPFKFNICLKAGNTLGRIMSEETKNKIRIANTGSKGIKFSEETKLKMRKPKSIEHKAKIKEAQKTVIKKVFQYNFQLVLIATFESISDCAKFTGFNRKQISSCCNGKKQNSVKGFLFTFCKINDSNINFYKLKVNKTEKTKNQYNGGVRNLKILNCGFCGKEFSVHVCVKGAKYCSVICRAKAVYNFKQKHGNINNKTLFD